MNWEERALRAEDALREIAAIPNDSRGWRLHRKQIAEEYIMNLTGPHHFYMRAAAEKEYAAELCYKGTDGANHTVVISDAQMLNMLRIAADIVSQRGLLKTTSDTSE
jgi:hypothetical protein